MKKLFHADIFHKRFSPKEHQFSYKGFYILFDIDQMEKLKSKIFGVNSFNLFSFYNRDHANRNNGDLRKWALNILNEAGVKDFKGEILLQTFPRVLGHVFNPVSFWFCYENKKLKAIICEVNNTFKESHNYVIKDFSGDSFTLPKEFHVSPFFKVEGRYRFNFSKKNLAKIDLELNEETKLKTSIKGKEVLWNDFSLLKLFFRFPAFSLIVLSAIHIEALKLFIKKIQFYTKPEKINKEVTYE
jgi:DUF1365 family protein